MTGYIDRLSRAKDDTYEIHDYKLKFPGKNEPGRRELDNIIVEAGKWAEVSQLDTTSLIRIIENNLWSKELIDKVMQHGRMEEIDSVSISRLREGEKE